jgi:hypothetical protein
VGRVNACDHGIGGIIVRSPSKGDPMNRRKGRTALIAGAALALTFTAAAPASAATVSDPILEDLDAPLGLAVGSDGTVYVSQNDFFGGGPANLSQLRKGDVSSIASAGFVTGVEANGRGTTSFLADGELRVTNPSGKTRTLANVAAFEFANNPDQVNTYGLQGLTAPCQAELESSGLPPEVVQALIPGPGVPDANPYAVAILPNGDRVVADAGGNTLLRVTEEGAVSTLAVMPPRPAVIDDATAGAFGLPACTIGLTNNFDFVPTDVELHNGMLYVSSLPGGPEGPSPLGDRGGVFTVDPGTGATTQIGDGFAAATDLAVTKSGDVYVTELFGGQVSMLSGGGPVPVASLSEPVAIEAHKGTLYVSSGVFGGPGQVVTITP